MLRSSCRTRTTRRRRWTLGALLLAAGALHGTRASAACPALAGGSPRLAAADVNARYAFIVRELERDAPAARSWTSGWAWGYGALTVAQFGAAPLIKDDTLSAAFYLGGAKTLFGLGSVLLSGPSAVAPLDSPSSAPDCKELRRAEAAFLAAASAERTPWYKHALLVVLNGATTAYLMVEYDEVLQPLFSGAVGIGLGEAAILTRPTGVVTGLERYRAGELQPHTASAPMLSWTVAPIVSRGTLGAALTLSL